MNRAASRTLRLRKRILFIRLAARRKARTQKREGRKNPGPTWRPPSALFLRPTRPLVAATPHFFVAALPPPLSLLSSRASCFLPSSFGKATYKPVIELWCLFPVASRRRSRCGAHAPSCSCVRFGNQKSGEMARFQEFEVMNDHRTVGGHVGHEDHLMHPLNLTAEEERVPKARKPYTISKQREKWTEDEHKLFLESLQLHGRAWRRIQEHIGSKTAVQIRSHAQKFFSKVTRESSGDGNNAAAAPRIRIPPPRPKKKPAHPYPRKLGNSPGKDAPVLKQLDKPQLQVQSLYEQENASPKSVLTVAQLVSETLAPDSNRSPASSVDVEERCPAPRIEVAAQLSPYKVANSDAVSKDESSVLTLFGKRVLVNDLHQQPNLDTGNQQNTVEMELDASAETPTSGTGKLSSNDAAEANTWSPWLTETKQFVYYLPQGEVFVVPSDCQFFSYYNGSIACTMLSPKANKKHQPSQAADSRFLSEEGSCRESVITSSDIPETLTQNSDSEELESMQVNNKVDEVTPLPGSRTCVNPAPYSLRGFVPYKRCIGESEMVVSQTPGEEADREMTRLCL